MHWPHFIVHSFRNMVQPNVQHVVHNANRAIVQNFEQFAPTLVLANECFGLEEITANIENM